MKSMVLVHGAFADATSWSSVIPLLEADGYHVVAVQNPLISFADEVAATKRVIELQDGPILLVAHSWGGVVITQAGDDPKVVGLVYISAYAPDAGQSVNDASSPYGWTEGQKQIRLDDAKFASMTFKGVSEDIAQRLPLCTDMSSIGNAWNLPRTYQRNSRGPSHAPIAAGIDIPSRYQFAMNGVASSGQCRV